MRELSPSLSPNLNTQALEKAQVALSFVEQLETLHRDLKAFRDSVESVHHMELDSHLSKLRSLYMMVADEGDEIEQVEVLKLDFKKLSDIAPNKIQRLGISKEILRLREAGHTFQEIATKFQLSPSAVSKFIKLYDAAKPVEKIKIKKASIFDTVDQFEELGGAIYRCLHRLEDEESGENYVKTLGELRQTIVAADKFMSTKTDSKKVEEIRNIVYEVLMEELPEKRVLIMQRFSSIGLRSAMTGST